MTTLTARQQEIFLWIRQYMTTKGMPPTRAELCQAMGFRSPNAAEDHLKALARKGVIHLLPGASRGIRLLQEEEPGIPLVGRVAAGQPILALEHVETHYQIDPSLFSPSADYLLRVKGESMREAGILDKDLLAVHQTTTARDGQIVVARLDDEVTVKRFFQQGPLIELHPENAAFPIIEVDLRLTSFAIEGLVVGVIRHQWSH